MMMMAGNPATAGMGATGGAGMGGAGMGGMAAGTGGSMEPPMTAGEPKLPMAPAMCPMIATGNITVLGQQVRLWVGEKKSDQKGSIFFYWHGTGGQPTEAMSGLGPALQEIQAGGGVVASFSTSTSMGTNTGNNVWYTGDFAMADQILACAIQQLNIDTHRIYTGGCSAGGLQSGAMVYGRSSYLAAAMPNSGGVVRMNMLEDTTHVPALITTHGAMGSDMVIVEFTTTSLNECMDIAKLGGFVVDCDHGGGHCQSPATVKAAQWQFLKDHPFGVTPEPYAAGLPSSFPSFCKVIK
jgi:predicted esterase